MENELTINKKPRDGQIYDVMDGCDRWEIKVHDHGFVALVDVMPRLVPIGRTADCAIVQAARTSTGQGLKSVAEDLSLQRFLSRHRHTTPTEMVEFKFHMAMPIFVARQFIRHRTANVNEYSARYAVVKDRFYHPTPESIRRQSITNKQGGDAIADMATASEFMDYLDRAEALYSDYLAFEKKGVSREMARIGLPLSLYTEWFWKCDLHNILHFLSLRMDKHAQQEIRDFANAIFALIQPIVPHAAQAFLDYNYNSMRLTALEIKAFQSKQPIASDNKRECDEWEAKKVILGL